VNRASLSSCLIKIPRWLGTSFIVGFYAVVMICTNNSFTILDDEANSLAIAGQPVANLIGSFIGNTGSRELHPPETEILWHVWLVLTHHSFFLLRVLANLFYIAAILLIAACSARLAVRQAYWLTLILGFAWPFSFQYGRIAGWYTLSTLLLSLVTWIYLHLIDDRSIRLWIGFAVASVALVWSNYFSFVFLALLLIDFILFHRQLAARQKWRLAMVAVLLGCAFLPLLRVASTDVADYLGSEAPPITIAHEIAGVGYPAFAMLASAAIAPWFWPLSIPVAVAAIVLLFSVWRSEGRRWLIYLAVAMSALEVTRVFDIKRVLFFLPWLFLAVALSIFDKKAPFRRAAAYCTSVLVICGWIGIISGRHYATSNLYEPWSQAARVVARDIRNGATVVSANPPFFFYLDYQLGLQGNMQAADDAYLGAEVYRANGYDILKPSATGPGSLHGKIVLVNGSGIFDDVKALTALDNDLAARCRNLGTYRAAPDPGFALKQHFIHDVPALVYRTRVTWYNCP